MAKIYIGTSGWSYPTGKEHGKAFSIRRGQRTNWSFTVIFFNTVEINSSFYRPPNPAYVANWVNGRRRVFFLR